MISSIVFTQKLVILVFTALVTVCSTCSRVALQLRTLQRQATYVCCVENDMKQIAVELHEQASHCFSFHFSASSHKNPGLLVPHYIEENKLAATIIQVNVINI